MILTIEVRPAEHAAARATPRHIPTQLLRCRHVFREETHALVLLFRSFLLLRLLLRLQGEPGVSSTASVCMVIGRRLLQLLLHLFPFSPALLLLLFFFLLLRGTAAAPSALLHPTPPTALGYAQWLLLCTALLLLERLLLMCRLLQPL